MTVLLLQGGPGRASAPIPPVTTSYSNPGGTGDRTATITITGTGVAGTANQIINGSFSNQTWFNGGLTNSFVTFDFGVAASKVIDEFKFYQSGAAAQGTWVLGGSNDNTTYTEFPESLALGATATGTFPVTNTTGYRYYRLRQTAGTTTSGPYVEEIEFKIG